MTWYERWKPLFKMAAKNKTPERLERLREIAVNHGLTKHEAIRLSMEVCEEVHRERKEAFERNLNMLRPIKGHA